MISSATGALAVVMVTLVVEHGVQYLFATVILMGFLQIAFGLFKLGKFIRLVPYSVFLGFVNGLTMMFFLAQIGHFKMTDDAYISNDALVIMGGLILLIMAIIHYLLKLTTVLPSTLVAIVAGSAIAIIFNLDTKTVGDMASISGSLSSFSIPNIPVDIRDFVYYFTL